MKLGKCCLIDVGLLKVSSKLQLKILVTLRSKNNLVNALENNIWKCLREKQARIALLFDFAEFKGAIHGSVALDLTAVSGM